MKHLFRFSLLVLALLLPATALAHDFEVDGIYYKINGTEATVTYRGTSYSQYDDEYSGSVTIPATVTYSGITYSVTSIGEWAFCGCWSLTSIDIPNSVFLLGEGAFCYCQRLTSITIPNSITSIGNYVFFICSGLTSVTIPESVTSIGDNAFQGCSALTSVTIPESVTSIGNSAFSGCSGLTSIDIPNSVTSIGNYALSNCSGLASITVDTNNTIYDSRNNCNAIIKTANKTLISGCKNTIIPNSVKVISNGAFYGCSELTSIDIPNSVTSIGESAFSDCSGLISITVDTNNAIYDSRNNCNAIIKTSKNTLIAGCQNTIIPNSVTSIGNYAFRGCSGLTSIDIPNSVTTIGNQAFYCCYDLTSISISNSVISIGSSAFANTLWYNNQPDGLVYAGLVAYKYKGTMPAKTNIIIAEGTLGIADYAFYGCSALTSIEIPNSVTSIGSYAFTGCTGLTSTTFPNAVTTIGGWAFSGCSGLTEIYSLAMTPPAVSSYTFDGCYGAILYVPKEAENAYRTANNWKYFNNIVGVILPGYTFEVNGLYYRVISDSTASVIANEEVENYYTGDVVIPDSVIYEGYTFAVTSIESNAFDGCYELTSITIPNTVESIGDQAFQGCSGLTSVTIGSGVTTIGAKAFNYCNALETVKCLGTVPPVMASADCFTAAAYNRATLLVPRNYEATYAAADYLYKFAHIDGWGSAGRGDVNGDGVMNIADVTFLIDAILRGDHEGVYFESADLNINGRLDIGDVTSLIDQLLNSN